MNKSKYIWVILAGIILIELGLWGTCNKPPTVSDWTPTQYFVQWNSAISLFFGIYTTAFGLNEYTDI